jgi:CHAT domain-containing protein
VRETRAALGALSPSDQPSPKAGVAGRDEWLSLLYRLMIAPVAQWLPRSPDDLVVLVPQGALFLLPYAALRDPQGRALIDSHTIVVAPSIQTLARLPAKRGARRGDAVVAGNPVFSDIRIGRSGAQVLRLPPLPGAEREAGVVAELLQTRPLIGREASKAAIVQRAPSADVIHLATHGTAEDVRRDGVPGALVLTATDRDDGLLTTSDLMALQLRADLVVLSACNTGLGSIHSEGVIGMSRAFLAVGARSVVVSLWSVSDQPTAELMQDFYRSLASAPSKAAALRQAMLSTRAKYADPLFWSGFMLIGASD